MGKIFNFSGNQKRSYRNSLEVVKKAAQVWKKTSIEFVAQLGDIIDGRAKYNTSSDNECAQVKFVCSYIKIQFKSNLGFE